MTHAADELRLAQPALSMHNKQLEEELGVSLLTRHSHGVSLTASGAILLPRAVPIPELDGAWREVQGDEREAIRSTSEL